jgi:hypothetical protein
VRSDGALHWPRLAALLAALALGAPGALAQVSPGPLAEAHRALEGSLKCLDCHERGGSMDRRCLACHTEVAWLKGQRRGLHARTGDRACASCHPDHGGREFQMIAWEEGSAERFDHRKAGYPLTGGHARLECRACHRFAFQRSEAARRMKRKDPGKSWLGLESACITCHQDPHAGQLGEACESCHATAAWKPASGFDHAKSDYPLTGKHAEVDCAKCHLASGLALAHDSKGQPIPLYRPLPHRDCASCHRDPHAGRFRGACASCHSTEGFAVIDRRGFDHGVTRYPLRGKHAEVRCASCHDPQKAWGKKPKFARCDDCHRDAHAGQATLARAIVDCAACHAVSGFHPATTTVAQHAASWPLDGAHARADCSSCHAKRPADATLGTARVALRPPHGRCIDCHRDPHAGRFATGGERPHPRGCLGCHGMERFRPSAVDVAAHAAFAYPLEGAHRAVPCQACHAELAAGARAGANGAAATAARGAGTARGGAREPALDFHVAFARCADCHRDPHGGQFARRRGGDACDTCHGLETFAPASRFDHNRDAAFKLEGVHARVACARCHPSARDRSGATRTVYRPIPTACASCHDDRPPSRRTGARVTPPRLLTAHEVSHERV